MKWLSHLYERVFGPTKLPDVDPPFRKLYPKDLHLLWVTARQRADLELEWHVLRALFGCSFAGYVVIDLSTQDKLTDFVREVLNGV